MSLCSPAPIRNGWYLLLLIAASAIPMGAQQTTYFKARNDSERCAVLSDWLTNVGRVAGNAVAQPIEKFIPAAAPAFRSADFERSIGVAYTRIDEKNAKRIEKSLQTCRGLPGWAITYVTRAFMDEKSSLYARQWKTEIARTSAQSDVSLTGALPASVAQADTKPNTAVDGPAIALGDLSYLRTHRAHYVPNNCPDRIFQGLDVPDGSLKLKQRPAVDKSAEATFRAILELMGECQRLGLRSIEIRAFEHGVPVAIYRGSVGSGWTLQRPDTQLRANTDALLNQARKTQSARSGTAIADRGISSAVLLRDDGKRATYRTGFARRGMPLFAMVHNVEPDEPLLRYRTESLTSVVRLVLSPSETQYVNEVIAPTFTGKQKPLQVTVLHYAKEVHSRHAIPYMTSRIELPIRITQFELQEDGKYQALRAASDSVINTASDMLAHPWDGVPYSNSLGPTEQYPDILLLEGFQQSTVSLVASSAESGPASRYQQSERAARVSALNAGYVYKNSAFWLAFPGTWVQWIVEGRKTELRSEVHRVAVLSYLRQRSIRCRANFGPNDGKFTTTRTRTVFNGFGIKLWETKTVDELLVERRFVPVYAYYTDAENGQQLFSATLRSMGTPGGLLQYVEQRHDFMMSIFDDIGRLYDLEGCQSPTVAQLAENLFRTAVNEPTVQQARVRIPRASTVTDPVYVVGAATTLMQSCAEYAIGTNSYDEQVSFCHCVIPKLEPVLTRFERDKYIKDFGMFYAATTNVSATSGQPPSFSIRQSCLR